MPTQKKHIHRLVWACKVSTCLQILIDLYELLFCHAQEDIEIHPTEGSAGMDMWNAPTVQSRQPLTYRLMDSVGLGGPR